VVSPVIQKKVALLGVPGVGKTSLVRRFVESAFDDKYLTTIGVKVDKKVVRVLDQDVMLMLWDVAGAEERFSVPSSYVRGAAGCVLVADGTRPDTLPAAFEIVDQIRRDLGTLPYVLLLNKCDLGDQWQVQEADAAARADGPVRVLRSSAKTGEGVQEAFLHLASAIIG
jgi:small GTP-binding protein